MKENVVQSIIELLKNCNDIELLYIIQSLLTNPED